jgi:hypothetical protein
MLSTTTGNHIGPAYIMVGRYIGYTGKTGASVLALLHKGTTMDITKRMGKKGGTTGSSSRKSCPDFFELDNGDFALIGTDVTAEFLSKLPKDSVCGPHERIVVVRRDVITSAKTDIPSE